MSDYDEGSRIVLARQIHVCTTDVAFLLVLHDISHPIFSVSENFPAAACPKFAIVC